MKEALLLLLILFLGTSMLPENGYSQNCNDYFPSKTGTEWELTSYDEKDKLISTNNYKIVSNTGDEFVISMKSTDKKGKELLNTTTKWRCEAGQLSVEMKDLFPPSGAMANPSTEVRMSGDNLLYPAALSPDQTLPDANAKMELLIDGMRFLTMTMKIYDRKVENNEMVSTPSGNYDCIKLSQNADVKSLINSKGKSVIWLAKNKGMVKTQNFTDKGKLSSTMLMTKFKE
jgi:hypothetical protein